MLFFHIPFLRPDPLLSAPSSQRNGTDGGLGHELFVILPIFQRPLHNTLTFNTKTWYHENNWIRKRLDRTPTNKNKGIWILHYKRPHAVLFGIFTPSWVAKSCNALLIHTYDGDTKPWGVSWWHQHPRTALRSGCPSAPPKLALCAPSTTPRAMQCNRNKNVNTKKKKKEEGRGRERGND